MVRQSSSRGLQALNPKIITIFGNDHFSALSNRIMEQQSLVDYGFYGNDVVEGFTAFLVDLLAGQLKLLDKYSGLVYREKDKVKHNTNALQLYNEDNKVRIIRNLETPEEY